MSRVSIKQIWQAQLERAESTVVMPTWSMEARSCLQEVYDLHDLSEWVKKTITSTSTQFRVTRLQGMDEFRPTAQGEQLYRLIPFMLPLLRQWPQDVLYHPNIELLAEVMSYRHPAVWEDTYQHGRYGQPRLLADLLNGVVQHIQHDGRSATFRKKLKRHEHLIEKTFDDLKTYFRELAHTHQLARVIRIELMPNIPIKSLYANNTYSRSHECVTRWVKHLESSFGPALPGWAFKLDRCVPSNGSNVLCHLVLLVDEMTEPEFKNFVRVAESAWNKMTEGQGQIVDCNCGDHSWQFRSSTDPLTVLDQLHAAAVYMAATDDLIRLKTDGGPPAIVMGSLPTKVKQRAQPRHTPAFPAHLGTKASVGASTNGMSLANSRQTLGSLELVDSIASPFLGI